MSNELERLDYGDFVIRVLPDEDPPNPRKECDNLGTMVCLHERYSLGDKNKLTLEEANELEARVEKEGGVVLKLYLYDHSGITIATKPFSCPWDSGRIGFIYVEKDRIEGEYGWVRYPAINREKAIEVLEGEVTAYDNYLTGGYCGIVVEDEKGNEVHSCWGYDDKKYAIEEAKGHVDWELKHREEQAVAAENSVGANPS